MGPSLRRPTLGLRPLPPPGQSCVAGDLASRLRWRHPSIGPGRLSDHLLSAGPTPALVRAAGVNPPLDVRRAIGVALGGLGLVRLPEGRGIQDPHRRSIETAHTGYRLELLNELDHLRLEILPIKRKARLLLFEIEIILMEASEVVRSFALVAHPIGVIKHRSLEIALLPFETLDLRAQLGPLG